MAEQQKLDCSIPCHLTADYAEAVKSLAGAKDMKPSKWLRQLVVAEINRQRLQAQSTLAATACLANDANETNDEEYDDE